MGLRGWLIERRIRQARLAATPEQREQAWQRAIALAERAKGWLVVDCIGQRSSGLHPIEVTKVAKLGTIYGRKHYRNGKVGAERAWGRK